jgi:hypothetical protein
MKELPNDQPKDSSLPDRVARYKLEVEKVVREVGEHPQYELKRDCNFDQLADKIEFVKDVQSICTSRIESEKYLIVGVDETTRSFVDVKNLPDFDEARIRSRLEKYLQPIPQFEVLNLESSDKKTFVLLVFPRQKTRRILVRETVEDSSGKTPKQLIRKGDLWTKGGSTGKRLATPEDWDEIYEEVVELETERRTRQRTAHFLERAAAQEKLRGGYGLASVPSFGTDEEFRALIESLCISRDRARFLVLLEGLRDDLIEAWYSIGAFGPADEITQIQASATERVARVRDHKTNVFMPAMQRLTSAAIYVVKNSGPSDFLAMVVQLLEEAYETTNRLRVSYLGWLSPRGLMPAAATEHISYTVPALESLVSLYLIGAYVVKRRKFEYFPILLRRVVLPVGADSTPDFSQPMAFWPLRSGWGEPTSLQYRDGRIKLCAERAQNDPTFLKLFGSGLGATEALCQYELLLELNSYLAIDQKRTAKSVAFMKNLYPSIHFEFWPSLIAFPLENITGIALSIFTAIQQKNASFLKPLLFDENLAGILCGEGEEIFLSLLRQLQSDKGQLEFELRRFNFGPSWPKELADALKKVG